MNNNNLSERVSTVTTTAVFSKDNKHRYKLQMEWDNSKPKLCIIMTFPSTADEMIFDQTTMLVRNGAVNSGYGSVVIVNLFSEINPDHHHTEKINRSVVLEECDKADSILVSFGRGTAHTEEKERLLKTLADYEAKLYTLIDSKGLPFSHPLSPLAHTWKIAPLKLKR